MAMCLSGSVYCQRAANSVDSEESIGRSRGLEHNQAIACCKPGWIYLLKWILSTDLQVGGRSLHRAGGTNQKQIIIVAGSALRVRPIQRVNAALGENNVAIQRTGNSAKIVNGAGLAATGKGEGRRACIIKVAFKITGCA